MINRNLQVHFAVLAAMLSLACGLAARAAEAEVPIPEDAEIATLIEEVTGDDAEAQPAAAAKLLKIGAPAVAPLADAAEVDDQKIVTRCFDILGRLYASDDQETVEAAEAALRKLSKSNVRIAAVRALTTLRLKKKLQEREARLKAAGAVPAIPQLRPQANMQIQIGGGVQTHSTTIDANGKRTTHAKNAAEEVEITDTKGKSIEVKHTRQVDGQEKTTEYKADSLADLKKKHPEAAKLFEKYVAANNIVIGGGGAIQIQIGGAAPPAIPTPAFNLGSAPTTSTPVPRTIRSEQEGRRIEITDQDGAKIRVKITRRVDDKDVSEEFAAEDLKTLSATHLEAARLYEKLTGRRID